jgi:endoglucanase
VPLLLTHATGQVTRAQEAISDTGYWHTSGTQILDASSRPVRIAGVTWYGMDSSHWVPAGLDFQRYTTIMDLVKLLGYNTIRLPFSNELVERDPIVTSGVAANPELHGQHALQVMDAIVAYAQQIGQKIILDDHRSRAARPMQVNTLDEALWYTRQYPESSWIQDWQTLALRYRGDDAVIGFDLRNEPHTEGPGPWNLAAYLHRSATWGPYHGIDNPSTDWRLAAERAGNAVLAINPHLLMIVEVLPLYPDSGQPNGVASSWWAGILTPVKRYPVELQVPHQLVYSVHEWGPRKHQMPWFTPMTERSLQRAWRKNWFFLLDNPQAPYAAPVLLGEFGTCNEDVRCVEDRQPDSQGAWFQMLTRFIRWHPELNWSFFALNGTNSNNCWADNGLLNATWENVSNLTLQANLRSLQATPGLLPTTAAGPLIPGTTTHRAPRSPTSKLCQLP